ncbi:pectate lyase family protein [Spirosoma validum]|uniref:Pectate lyase superfamily protein domain-containing protein n=1 Tax=Spirosoma validum TaxID=2771355 RepID=A0A927B1C3_9BACT|nr:glycosyl hydrolase family 28-related protein [Spirosoma validum]MBD2753739.1 hypothetical protein [Spirosoma validum]
MAILIGLGELWGDAKASALAVKSAADEALSDVQAIKETVDNAAELAELASSQAQSTLANINQFQFTPSSLSQLRSVGGSASQRTQLLGRVTPGDGGGGDFFWNPNSTADDDGAMVIKVPGINVGRYHRMPGPRVSPLHFGAKGDGYTDDSAAVQAAINYVLKANHPGQTSPYDGNPGSLFLYKGEYRIKDVEINGSIKIEGEGGGTYAQSYFVVIANHTGIWLGPDSDGVSQSTYFDYVAFKSESIVIPGHTEGQVYSPDIAHVKTKSSNTIQSNSVYFNYCWFQSMQNCGVWATQGDDWKFTDCCFDVSSYDAIRLGTLGGRYVANARIINCTFFGNRENCIRLYNVRSCTISMNPAYTAGSQLPNSNFINGLQGTVNNLQVLATTFDSLTNFCLLESSATNVNITNQVLTNLYGVFLYVNGGGIMRGLRLSQITFESVAGQGWVDAPIRIQYCGLEESTIDDIIARTGITSPLLLDIPGANVTGNQISRVRGKNFTAIHNLAKPGKNGQEVVFAKTVTTANWSAGSYTQIVPANLLEAGSVYLISMRYNKPQVQIATMSYTVPIEGSSSGSIAPTAAISGNVVTYNGQPFDFTLKYLPGSAGWGLQAMSTGALGGTLSISVRLVSSLADLSIMPIV